MTMKSIEMSSYMYTDPSVLQGNNIDVNKRVQPFYAGDILKIASEENKNCSIKVLYKNNDDSFTGEVVHSDSVKYVVNEKIRLIV